MTNFLHSVRVRRAGRISPGLLGICREERTNEPPLRVEAPLSCRPLGTPFLPFSRISLFLLLARDVDRRSPYVLSMNASLLTVINVKFSHLYGHHS